MGKHRTFKEDRIWLHTSDDRRAWLHWGRACWHAEWHFGKEAHHNSIGLRLGGDENDFTISAGIKGLFGFYFGLEGLIPWKWKMKTKMGYSPRQYGITLYEEYIWFDFHRDDYGFSEGWKGLHLTFDWHKFVFGKTKYETVDHAPAKIWIKLPEGEYLADAKMFESTWSWKRFKKPHKMMRCEVTPEIPVPVPGKGENSWDCDDDAIYCSTFPCESLEEAAVEFAESIMRTRRKYASEDWVPVKGFHRAVTQFKK
jgi:hypothetical protein